MRACTAEDALRHAAFKVLMGEACLWRAPIEFPRRAKAFGLDFRRIVDAAALPPKPAVHTSAATASAARKKGAGKGKRSERDSPNGSAGRRRAGCPAPPSGLPER